MSNKDERIKELTAALEKIIGSDNTELTTDDLLQHDRIAGYANGIRSMADIARSVIKER